jgi:hypothetical protein
MKWREVTIMGTVLQDYDIRRRVYLSLKETAAGLSSHDLLKIAGVAGQVHGVVRIRPGSWQVLVDVPEINCHKLGSELLAIGFRHAGQLNTINERSTFLLGGVMNETPL